RRLEVASSVASEDLRDRVGFVLLLDVFAASAGVRGGRVVWARARAHTRRERLAGGSPGSYEESDMVMTERERVPRSEVGRRYGPAREDAGLDGSSQFAHNWNVPG